MKPRNNLKDRSRNMGLSIHFLKSGTWRTEFT